jgi:glutamate/tyrosine decarboxylase-like PLP-dependent enzyme
VERLIRSGTLLILPTGTGPGSTLIVHLGYGRPRRPATARWSPGAERADSWATDAHKTLNVPHDNGIAIVANAEAMYAAMGAHAVSDSGRAAGSVVNGP